MLILTVIASSVVGKNGLYQGFYKMTSPLLIINGTVSPANRGAKIFPAKKFLKNFCTFDKKVVFLRLYVTLLIFW